MVEMKALRMSLSSMPFSARFVLSELALAVFHRRLLEEKNMQRAFGILCFVILATGVSAQAACGGGGYRSSSSEKKSHEVRYASVSGDSISSSQQSDDAAK